MRHVRSEFRGESEFLRGVQKQDNDKYRLRLQTVLENAENSVESESSYRDIASIHRVLLERDKDVKKERQTQIQTKCKATNKSRTT